MAEPGRRAKRALSYRVPTDEQIVAAVTKVILRKGQVASQRQLAELVARDLKSTDARYRVSGERVRALALKSGLVGVSIHARVDGETPKLDRCPVCGSALKRTSNRTLSGGAAQTGYKCARCPWWTGRDYRIPQRYGFFALLKRRGEAARGQLTFRDAGVGDDA